MSKQTYANLSTELKAIATIEAALKDLEDDERARVMQWVVARFKVAGRARLEYLSEKETA